MTTTRWDTKKIASIGLALGAAAILIALGANGRLFVQPIASSLAAALFAALLCAGLFAAVSGLKNYHETPNAPTTKWNTGRIALGGAGIGLLLAALNHFGAPPLHADDKTQMGYLMGSLAGGIIWCGMLAGGFSGLHNYIVRRRIVQIPGNTNET